MTKVRLGVVAVLLVGLICALKALSLAASSFAEPEEGFDSLRLAALAKALKSGNTSALANFWGELQGKAPLVEPVADDPHACWVTFIWRGDAGTKRVNVLGGPATNDFAAWMKRLGDTDLWYRTDRIPNDARFVYRFQVNRPLRFPPDADKRPPLAPPSPDPFNPRQVPSMDGSLAELPEAPPQPWLRRAPGAPQRVSNLLEKLVPKRLTEHSIHSDILKQERTFAIYTPPDYDQQGAACGLLVLFDALGSQPDDLLPTPIILDNLISEKKLPPLVAVLAYQRDRVKELSCSQAFADFVATELVPRIRKDYRVAADPKHAIVCGISQGGLMAAYCGYRHSEVFGNVLSLSGAFQWTPGLEEGRVESEPGWLTRQFISSPRLPVRFYLAVGSFENYWPFSQIAETRRIRDGLLAKGYAVGYREYSGGHDLVGWGGPFVSGLIYLTDRTNKVE